MKFDYYSDKGQECNMPIVGFDSFTYDWTKSRMGKIEIKKRKRIEKGLYLFFYLFRKQYAFHFYKIIEVK